MNHLLTIKDWTKDQVLDLLDLADDVKGNPKGYSSKLDGCCLLMLFEKTSTRTRISFENGMYQLGGNAIYLDKRASNLHLGSLSDEVRVMSEYVDLLMARVKDHEALEVMKESSSVPVINGLSDLCHPCQILSDFMTIRENWGSLENFTLAWVGDGNNVCNSLVTGALTLGIPIHVASPKNYGPHEKVIEWSKKSGKAELLSMTSDPVEAVKDADFIYTDTHVSMGQEHEEERRLKDLKPFQLNATLIRHSKKDPYIMHCMPLHRGIEITDEVVESSRSIIFEQANNRLHLQKALMLTLLEKQ